MFTTTVSSSSSAVAASKTLEEEYVQHADLYDGSKQTQLFSGLQGRALNAKEKGVSFHGASVSEDTERMF